VNATPSGSCTSQAGGRGGSKARRVCTTTGPSQGCSWMVDSAGHAGGSDQPGFGPIDGTRCVMTVHRGALSARHAAQGRVGGIGPRHDAALLVGHPLLLANTSAIADAVRPRSSGGARPWPVAGSTVLVPASPPKAQPTDRSSPQLGARDTELAQPARVAVGIAATLRRRPSRGKGVLAV
jgi:hypothetical protein